MSEGKHRGGRPRKARRSKLPYDEVDRLLVEGELVLGEDGVETRVWPTQREVARRFGVSLGLIGMFASESRCFERKLALQAGRLVPPSSLTEPGGPATEDAEAPPDAPAEAGGPATEDAEALPDAPTEESPRPPKRKPGRPRYQDAPLIPYEELDRLLVFGELQVHENGTHTTIYPSYRQLAKRYGVASSVIAAYSKSHDVLKRRAQTATRVAARTEDKLINQRADALAVGEARLIQMIDEFLLKFEAALKEGRVRTDNPADVNTLVRLKQFIQGGADSRQEIRYTLSLEALQERYARAMRDQRDATPAMAGVLDARADVVETKVVEAGVHPPKLSENAVHPRSDLAFLNEVRTLLRLSRELALATGADSDDDSSIENRVLRAADRVEVLVAAHDGADVGARDDEAEENRGADVGARGDEPEDDEEDEE